MENRISLWTDVVSAVKKTIFLKYTIEQKSKDRGHISQFTLYLWLKTLYNELVENVGCPLLKPKVHSLDFSLKLTRVHCFVKQSFLYLLWTTALRAQECCHQTSFQPLKRHVTTVGSTSQWNSKDSGKKREIWLNRRDNTCYLWTINYTCHSSCWEEVKVSGKPAWGLRYKRVFVVCVTAFISIHKKKAYTTPSFIYSWNS